MGKKETLELLLAAKYFRELFERIMHDKYDYPNDPWHPHRIGHDSEYERYVQAISNAEKLL